MKTRTVTVTSDFPASIDEIWEKLQSLNTLQHIASPYAKFQPVGNTEQIWREGQTSEFNLKLFCFIPMGIHTIEIIQFDKTALTIYSNERNIMIPVWNHRITLSRISDGITHYSDEVEVFAGWKTPFVCAWSKAFYKHRQRRWIKLLNKLM
jgi:hypothetical protein